MVQIRGIGLPNLSGKHVFIGAGTNDPICSAIETKELLGLLESANAKAELHWENWGHQLTMEKVEEAAIWYNKILNS
jgi:phospholipase/carboxylesterase